MERTAALSPCGAYRYRLGRRWAAGVPLLFVMLNPSTADADADDPTIRRCITFARTFDYSGIEVVNLFAYRATKPADLRAAGYPIGPDNDDYILAAVGDAGGAEADVALAWGAGGHGLARALDVIDLLRTTDARLLCLETTKAGCPAHPLYLPGITTLRPFGG